MHTNITAQTPCNFVMATNNREIEATQTWNKLVDSATKTGYREGAFNARANVFQECFDDGYLHGFRNGFIIGKYKGAVRATTQSIEDDTHLKHSKGGWCQICRDNSILQSTTQEIINIQTQFSNNLLKNLNSKYLPVVSIPLQKNLQ